MGPARRPTGRQLPPGLQPRTAGHHGPISGRQTRRLAYLTAASVLSRTPRAGAARGVLALSGGLPCNRRTRAVGTSGAEHRRICPDGYDVVRLDLRLQTHAQRIGHVDLEVQDFPQGRGLLPFDLVVEVDGKGHRLPRSGVVVQADRGGEGVPVTAEVVLRPGNTPAEAPFGGAQHTVVIVTVHLRTSRPPAAVLGLDRVHLGQEHLVAARYGLRGRLLAGPFGVGLGPVRLDVRPLRRRRRRVLVDHHVVGPVRPDGAVAGAVQDVERTAGPQNQEEHRHDRESDQQGLTGAFAFLVRLGALLLCRSSDSDGGRCIRLGSHVSGTVGRRPGRRYRPRPFGYRLRNALFRPRGRACRAGAGGTGHTLRADGGWARRWRSSRSLLRGAVSRSTHRACRARWLSGRGRARRRHGRSGTGARTGP